MTESFEEGLHVVVGATGGTGRVIVRELARMRQVCAGGRENEAVRVTLDRYRANPGTRSLGR